MGAIDVMEAIHPQQVARICLALGMPAMKGIYTARWALKCSSIGVFGEPLALTYDVSPVAFQGGCAQEVSSASGMPTANVPSQFYHTLDANPSAASVPHVLGRATQSNTVKSVATGHEGWRMVQKDARREARRLARLEARRLAREERQRKARQVAVDSFLQ